MEIGANPINSFLERFLGSLFFISAIWDSSWTQKDITE